MKFSQLRKPFICVVIAERNVSKCINAIDEIEKEGVAEAFEVNLPPLGDAFLKDVFSSSSRPFIASCRRAEFMKIYGYYHLPALTEQERAERLLKALASGAKVIDFELDMFDEEKSQRRKPAVGTDEEVKYGMEASPALVEFSSKPRVARQQKEFSKKIKSVGGEVMISCHAQTRVAKEQILRVADMMTRRGADLIKIVTMTFDSADLVKFLDSVIELKKDLTIPFNLMNLGENVILGRLLSATLGSSWIYCRRNSNSEHYFKGQPTIHEAREFLKKFSGSY